MMKIVSWIKRRRGVSNTPSTPSPLSLGAAEVKEAGVEKAQLLHGSQPVVNDDAKETPRRIVSNKRKIGLRSVLVVFLGFIAVGLARVARESRGTSRFMSTRYEAVYARLWR